MLAPILILVLSCQPDEKEKEKLTVAGLQESVEVLRDSAGVNHIYARNEHDLFFAQGYCAAKDRLFQFEIWRRQATGTLSEILGSGEVKRDIAARLFRFRGDLKKEFNHYHPNGEQIINSFTEGINAFVHETQKDTSLLTLEFKLLGIQPGLWRPEDVISRHQGLLGNLPEEIRFARAVATLGESLVKELVAFEPGIPDLRIDPKIDKTGLFDSIGLLYTTYKSSVKFKPEHLLASNRNTKNFEYLSHMDEVAFEELMSSEKESIGSNNWIVAASRSASGYPLLANDPHRAVTAPSLRYMVHLNAPGWNVVGGGEPTVPGVSIGHNENGAWGLTVFSLDGEDLYVYQLNPKNHNQYRFGESWVDMRVEYDTVKIKDATFRPVELRFTRHGPVLFVDSVRHVAYAVRCAWLEPGGAPYLASLRIDQAKTWEEFREGCSYSHIPGENMIWVDKSGNIGWQAVGIAPIRRNHSGLVPVPADSSYEWDGYLPITSLPNVLNPKVGFLATANENNVPADYPNRNAVGWNWADRFRVDRIREILASGEKHTLEAMMRLQFDYTSIPARKVVPWLTNVRSADPVVEAIRHELLNWNFRIDKYSREAAVYVAWEKKMTANLRKQLVPAEGQRFIRSISLRKLVGWLSSGPSVEKSLFMLKSLEEAVGELKATVGEIPSSWTYGQAKLHHVLIKHPLSNAVNENTRKILELGPMPRSGYGATPGMTTNSNNQTSGASFRIVVDAADWDKTMFTQAPGQSGNPASRYYGNLFRAWAMDQHFPVYFSRDRVVESAVERLLLEP